MISTEKYRGMRLIPPQTRHGNVRWYVRGSLAGRVIELSTKRLNRTEAMEFVDDLLDGSNGRAWTQFLPAKTGIPKWAKKLQAGAKERARRSGVNFTLTDDDMAALVKRAWGRCEITGIPFSSTAKGASWRAPFIPSIDRIVPGADYTFDNCRLVAFAVNIALSDWGELVLFKIARGVMRNMRGKELERD